MKYLTLCMAALLLSACAAAKERQDNALHLLDSAKNTASGAMQEVLTEFDDVLQKGKTVTDGVGEMVDDAKRRIDQVQSGVNMVMDGKEMIQGGLIK